MGVFVECLLEHEIAVFPALVHVEDALVSGGEHRFVEGLGPGKGGDGVASAVKGEGGRKSGADVVDRGEILPAFPDLGLAVTLRRGVDHGKEQHHCIGTAGDIEVVRVFVHLVEKGGRGGEVSPGRSAADDEFRRIDPQFGGVGADVANRGTGVLHAIEDCRGAGFVEPVLDADPDHAVSFREIGGEGIHPARVHPTPAAAVDHVQTGTLVCGGPAFGQEKAELELAIRDLFINHDPVGGEGGEARGDVVGAARDRRKGGGKGEEDGQRTDHDQSDRRAC